MPKRRGRGAPAPVRPAPIGAGIQSVPFSIAPTVPVDDKAALHNLLRALEQPRRSRVLVYWTTDIAKISEAAVYSLYDQLAAIGHVDRLDLLLFTRGGDTEAPWRIVSLIREFCDHFAVLVPYRASSAGTLISLGADQIVMTPLGALGPIDPSRTHPLLPRIDPNKDAEPVSVQDMRHAMRFIRETAGEGKEPAATTPYTPEAMAQILSVLFDKVHPLVVGAIEQSYALAKLVATQCLSTHMDWTTQGAEIQTIVDRLCDEYKSHAYPINRKEAREMGLNVVDAPADVDRAMMDLLKFYTQRPTWPGGPPSVAGRAVQAHIAWLDSTSLNLRVEAEFDVVKPGEAKLKGDKWTPY